MKIVGIAILAILVIRLLMWALSRRYRRLLSDDHYMEIPRLVAELKRDAVALIGTPVVLSESPDGPEDLRFRLSQHGMSMVYTIDQAETQALHRMSLSDRGGPMAFAAGGLFAFFILDALGIAHDSAAVAHSGTGVIHFGFTLDEPGQEAFVKRPVTFPKLEEIPGIKERSMARRNSLISSRNLLMSEAEVLARLGFHVAGQGGHTLNLEY